MSIVSSITKKVTSHNALNRSKSKEHSGLTVTRPNGQIAPSSAVGRNKSSTNNKSSEKISNLSNDDKKNSRGTIVERSVKSNNVSSNNNNNSKQIKTRESKGNISQHANTLGSDIQRLNKDTKRKSRPSGVSSAVSCQIERRKRNKRINSRHSGISSRRSSMEDYSDVDNGRLKRYQSDGMLNECSTVIRELAKEEITLLLNSMRMFRKLKDEEERRKGDLENELRNILDEKRQRRPITSGNQCSKCNTKFIPFIRSKTICNNCNIGICEKCYVSLYKGIICDLCRDELRCRSKLCEAFTNYEATDILMDVLKLERVAQEYKMKEMALANKVTDKADDVKRVDSTTNRSISLTDTTNEVQLLSRLDSTISTSTDATHSQDGNTEDEYTKIQGVVIIGLSFDFKEETLRVVVKSCRKLQPVNKKHNSINSFVKVTLLPDPFGENKRRTKVVNNALNPDYNELIKFKQLAYDELLSRSILVSVWHHEFLTKDVFLGECKINFSATTFESAAPVAYNIETKRPVTIPPNLTKYYGDINFGMKITIVTSDSNLVDVNVNAESGSNNLSLSRTDCFTGDLSDKIVTIELWIKEASNLLTSRYNRLPSAYVKCIPLPEKEFNVKKRTPVVRKNFNPIWNTAISLPDLTLSSSSFVLEIGVWDKKSGLLPDNLMGVIYLDIKEAIDTVSKEFQDEMNMTVEQAVTLPNKSKTSSFHMVTTERDLCYQLIKENGRWVEVKLPLKLPN